MGLRSEGVLPKSRCLDAELEVLAWSRAGKALQAEEAEDLAILLRERMVISGEGSGGRLLPL